MSQGRGATVLLLTLVVGCSSDHEASLSGVVTYQGQPIAHALMNFHNAQAGPMAYAMTDEEGRYEAKTGSVSGLMPGKYRLAFQSQPDRALPEKYTSIESSGLEYDIAEGHNEIDIDLQ